MSIRITMLSENTASEEGIVAEWGLSVFVEAGSHKILFDTGLCFSAAYNTPIFGNRAYHRLRKLSSATAIQTTQADYYTSLEW